MNAWQIIRGAGFPVPGLLEFRCVFTTQEEASWYLEYSADERAILFLDGEFLASGPERGAVNLWYRSRVEKTDLAPGTHQLRILVAAFGKELTAYAQMSVEPGLYLWDCSLGKMELCRWQCRVLPADFCAPLPDWGAYPRIHLRAEETAWEEASVLPSTRQFVQGTLPAMLYARENGVRRCGNQFYFDEYRCRYGRWRFRGRGLARIRYAEEARIAPLKLDDEPNAFFDEIEVNGSCDYHDFFFHAGQSAEMKLDPGVSLESVEFFRTGYPWRYRAGNMPDNPVWEVSLRTFECCTFETFMDCPYYEQLLYVGDSRIEMLTAYALSEDTALQEKSLRLLGASLSPEGWIFARYPAKDYPTEARKDATLTQPIIPGFSLLYISMLADFAALGKNQALVRELLGVARAIWGESVSHRNADGLLNLPGWNFIDWLPNWKNGVSPGGLEGGGCTLNLLALAAWRDYAYLEQEFGNEVYARDAENTADELARAIEEVYFDPDKKAFAEDISHKYFSEHAQVLGMILLGRTEATELLRTGKLDRCGIYFSFYYFEMCRMFGLQDLAEARGKLYEKLATQVSAMPEEFSSWRSCCHAWSAHRLYHHAPFSVPVRPFERNYFTTLFQEN